jgi:hypothetical protein
VRCVNVVNVVDVVNAVYDALLAWNYIASTRQQP